MSLDIEVVDSACGQPAAGVPITFLREVDAAWSEQAVVRTDDAGLALRLETTPRGRYRVVLSFDEYFAGLGLEPFQSRVDVVFRVFHAGEKVRLLLLVSPSSCAVHRIQT